MNLHTEPQLEIHLPDEERARPLELYFARCPCGSFPSMFQRQRRDAKGLEYQVRCGAIDPWARAEGSRRHYDPTPWFPSSHQAIQHWKLVAALSRP